MMSAPSYAMRLRPESEDDTSGTNVLDRKIVEEEDYFADTEEEGMSNLADFLSELRETSRENENTIAAITTRQKSVVKEDMRDTEDVLPSWNFLANLGGKYGDNTCVSRRRMSHSVSQFFRYKRKYRSDATGRAYFFPSLKEKTNVCKWNYGSDIYGLEHLLPSLKKHTNVCNHRRGYSGPTRTVQLFYACTKKYSSRNSSSWRLIEKDSERRCTGKKNEKIVKYTNRNLPEIPVRPTDDGSMFVPIVSHNQSRFGLYLYGFKKYYSSSSSDESSPKSEFLPVKKVLSEKNQWLVIDKKKHKTYKSINSDSEIYTLNMKPPLPSGFYFSE